MTSAMPLLTIAAASMNDARPQTMATHQWY